MKIKCDTLDDLKEEINNYNGQFRLHTSLGFIAITKSALLESIDIIQRFGQNSCVKFDSAIIDVCSLGALIQVINKSVLYNS
jgi:hypothetical protein